MPETDIMEQRRKEVRQLRLARMSIHDIAKKLGWNYETIWKDVDWWRKYYKSNELKQKNDPLIQFLMENDQQYQNAILVFTLAKNSTPQNFHAMNKANSQMGTISKDRIEVLQDFGVLPRDLGTITAKTESIIWDLKLIKNVSEQTDIE